MITGIVLGKSGTPGTVTRKSRKSSVTTLTTKTTHHLSVGDDVVVAGVGSEMDGTFTVSAVPAKNKFSYKQQSKGDVKEGVASGTYTKNSGPAVDISDIVTSVSVSLSMSAVSQVTITVSDPGLLYMSKNYFQIRQKIKVAGQYFEVASIEVGQGQAGEQVTMECRLAGVQRLKRDKGKAVYSGGSATSYVSARARVAGLGFFGENSSAKSNISRVRNDKTDESTWDVMKRLAGDNQFVLFETGGRVFFCSQQFLLGKYSLAPDNARPGFLTTIVKWSPSYSVTDGAASSYTTTRVKDQINGPAGRPTLRKGSTGKHVEYLQKVLKSRFGPDTLPTYGKLGTSTFNSVVRLQKFYGITEKGVVGRQTWTYVDMLASGTSTTSESDQGFFSSYAIVPMEVPNVRRSDDSYEEVTASFRVEKEIGKKLRPGMTISMRGIPGFTVDMLINEVSWEEGTPDPVSVSASTPLVPDDATKAEQARAKVDLTGGGFGNTTALSF